MENLSPDFHHQIAVSWAAMGEGAPMLGALAGICAKTMLHGPSKVGPLSPEEQAICYLAKDYGALEVRGVHTGFEAPLRFLAVYVEMDANEKTELRNRFHPEITIRFFEAFCDLCRRGYVLHHLHHDFSLSNAGFAAGREVSEDVAQRALEQLRQDY